MAVAVKNKPDASPTTAGLPLGTASVVGAVVLAAALAAIFVGVPRLWESSIGASIGNKFLERAGFLIVEGFAIGLLAMLALTYSGSAKTPGLIGGIVAVFAWVLGTFVVMSAISRGFPDFVGDAVAVVLGAASAFYGWQQLSSDKYPAKMEAFETQGWFTAGQYKPNQGRKVRRGTLLGLLVLFASGIWSMLHGSTLETAGWSLRIPFLEKAVTVLPDPKFTVPLIAIGFFGWLAYRLVNMPTFAEFLIATEGELNKIAWPNRKSLIQDTIVVLTTVVLMTLFLLFVDLAWAKILSNPWVNVLQLDAVKTKTQGAYRRKSIGDSERR